MWIGYMGVDLCGRDVTMAQKCLDRTEIGTIHQEVGSIRVAQGVWRYVLGYASEQGIAGDESLD